MRKRFLAALSLSIMALFFGAATASAAQEPVGSVMALKGTATVLHAGESKPVNLTVNAPVFLMDKLNTGAQSKVKLLMKDETIVTLGQEGEMVINEFVYQPETSIRKATLKLVKGSVRNFISKVFSGVGSAFDVRTPTAVAGARGTHNLVDVISPERTLIVGISDITTASNSDPSVHGEQLLTDSHGSYIDLGQPPTPPFVVPDTVLQPLLEHTDLKEEKKEEGKKEGGEGKGDASDAGGFAPPEPLPEPVIVGNVPIDPNIFQDTLAATAATDATAVTSTVTPPAPTGPVLEGAYLASINSTLIWSGSLTDQITASSPDSGATINFTLHHTGLTDATFGIDTTTAFVLSPGVPGVMPSLYFQDMITGGTNVWGADVSQFPEVLFTGDEDFFIFTLTDTPFGVFPWVNAVEGYVGVRTPASALPASGVSLFAVTGDSIVPGLETLGKSSFNLDTILTVDWAKGLMYGAGFLDDGNIILGSVDRANSQMNFSMMSRTEKNWAGGLNPSSGLRYGIDSGGSTMQFFGASGPAGVGSTFLSNAYDENKVAHTETNGAAGFNLINGFPTITPVADGEVWHGFATGFLFDRSTGAMSLIGNPFNSDVAMSFTPSTGKFTGQINTSLYSLSVGDAFGDKNVFISPQAFGAAGLRNGTPAYIAVASTDVYSDPYNYLTWGTWSTDEATVPEQTIFASSPWIAGQLTPTANIPVSGTATYNGTVEGFVNFGPNGNLDMVDGTTSLTADFGACTLNGTFNNLTNGIGTWVVPTATVNSSWSAGTNDISGSLSGTELVSSTPLTGQVFGSFFGPAAQEVGGSWTLHDASNATQAGGIFRARQ